MIAHVSPHLQDAAHTVNTLSYAAPFKVAIPPPKKALRYDDTDPRTWNNEQLIKWFTIQVTNLARQDSKKGSDSGSNPTSRSPSPTTKMTIDPIKMFPPPTTGKQATRLYCGEWVAQCLASTTLPTPLSPGDEKVVTTHALDVYSSFGYLWATARTRTRKAVLSRRNQDDEETYWGA